MLTHFIALALAATTIANAHMIMVTPTPYGVSDLNNSPLAADGSDFPCKQRGANTYNGNGASNEWPIGSTQTLSFKGSAVHGGGSCQVSLTTDKTPTKDSHFFVVHSIVGGCPSNTTNGGNLPPNPDGTSANKYTFTVPDGVTPGEYTMAWTWFNRIGNREMYMNCAPITVTGGSSSTKTKKRAVEKRKAAARSLIKRATYPDMFVANIGSGCGTSEGADVDFPNPGDSVERDAADGKYAPPTGSCASGSGSSPNPGSPPLSSSSSSSTPVAAPSPSSSTTLTTTTVATSTIPSSVVASSSVPSSPATPSPSSSSSSSSGALTGPCTLGQWNCFNGGQSFQQCAAGGWSVEQPTAAGNPCKVGLGASAPW
ncbi:MAG: hypothetical protein GOMPHAMPRED_007405 [Gomphillus americanus]|uniref:Lytic polysaccharide monooxygenase n=1 Tax=Gomphillus americanus TaxID=1940652 RepID=A0A8H3ETJ6_9LECA|nr:MAG: hypothetical protein GOMPHAMPRED_007405 [Gomphillus americanus]